MTETSPSVERDCQLLAEAESQGRLARYRAYMRLSGPGWLQGAITLGGGSLASSLYLGVIAGVSLLWLQPLAMILGLVMLSAIAYVALSTGERPFRSINQHINPVLGWGWLLASLVANMVWALPQYSLFYGAMENNLAPGLFGKGAALEGDVGKWTCSLCVLAVSTLIVWSYGSGHWGVKLYERILKIIVALIVLCFFSVVAKMAIVSDDFSWAEIAAGFIPDPRQLFEPIGKLGELVAAIGDVAARDYWTNIVVQEQREVMISAAATAVGINMTFLLPYSMLAKGWSREFRGLVTFDLSTGMFIPFVLATSCVIIASAVPFHGQLPEGVQIVDGDVKVPDNIARDYEKRLGIRGVMLEGSISLEEKTVAAAMLRRNAGALATSLEGLFDGDKLMANFVFGLGVAGMALSTISLLMLISGFVVCEVLNVPSTGWPHRLGCMVAATGVLWPLLWKGNAKFWLAIITSNFGMVLLPVAYLTFFLMMNSRSLLGDDMPRSGKRLLINLFMTIATAASGLAAIWVVWNKCESGLGSKGIESGGWYGMAAIGLFAVLVVVGHLVRSRRPAQ